MAFSRHTGIRLAEVGFLLLAIAGIWLAVAQMVQLKLAAARTIVSGIALAAGGVLLLVATHWAHFG